VEANHAAYLDFFQNVGSFGLTILSISLSSFNFFFISAATLVLPFATSAFIAHCFSAICFSINTICSGVRFFLVFSKRLVRSLISVVNFLIFLSLLMNAANALLDFSTKVSAALVFLILSAVLAHPITAPQSLDHFKIVHPIGHPAANEAIPLAVSTSSLDRLVNRFLLEAASTFLLMVSFHLSTKFSFDLFHVTTSPQNLTASFHKSIILPGNFAVSAHIKLAVSIVAFATLSHTSLVHSRKPQTAFQPSTNFPIHAPQYFLIHLLTLCQPDSSLLSIYL